MKAIVRLGGREFLVEEGGTLRAQGRIGALAEEISVPAPLVFETGAGEALAGQVKARVIDVRRGRKVLSYRFKRKKGVHKIRGSRPYETLLRVEAITPDR